ncbi:MAG: hypothetical protein V4717_09690 [Bacteroidota bacterium]
MLGNKKGLLLAGIAAYAYYKYNKMSAAEKEKMVGGLKEKGRKFYDQYVPSEVKNMFEKKGQTAGRTTDETGDFAI